MRANALAAMLLLMVLFLPSVLMATPEYAERAGQGCQICHVDPMGGTLSEKGLEFAASGYVWPPQGGYRVMGPIRHSIRFFIGLSHIVAAFLWFGTILYVHLLLKPAYAEKGLPRGEVRLGMVAMAVVGISGILLTVSRVRSLDVLFASPWGIVLCIKIAIYLVMILSAVVVILFVGPRLKNPPRVTEMPESGVFDPVTLAGFDGAEGRRALIAYEGKVYDVTALKRWQGGMHMKHRAGEELTAAMARAPHGQEKLEGLRVVGTFDAQSKAPKTGAQRAFYVVAYMNLTLVFVVLITISYWRWGI